MTVKELHDVLAPMIKNLDEKYEKHIDNHNDDIKSLNKFRYMIIGGLLLLSLIIAPVLTWILKP